MSNRKKIYMSITSLVIIIVLVFTLAFALDIYPNYLAPQPEGEDWALSSKARSALMTNFNYNYDTPSDVAPLKRKIDKNNPLHLVNCYDLEALELWQAIPDNQKPYTVIILIYSSALLPQLPDKLAKLEASAELCEANSIPYCIQVASGETPMESRYPVGWLEERFASQHDYFYGVNCAELYNGIVWRGEAESNQSLYMIELINMVAKYGAFFFWTDANMRYEDGAIITWLETNESLYSCFKANSQNIVMMNKESSSTMQGGLGNPTSYAVMQGLWLAGLIGAWGSKSDWWHWQYYGNTGIYGEPNADIDSEWDVILNYPESLYLQGMTLVMSRGGVCFSQEAPAYSMIARGKRVAGYQYGIIPMLDNILNGNIEIPDRETVLKDTTLVILGYDNYVDINYDFKKSNQYPETGRYSGILPLLPRNMRRAERAIFEQNGIMLIDSKKSKSFYNKMFANIDADTYLTRTGKQWFYLVTDENARVNRYASFSPVENNASNVRIETTQHTTAIVKESSNQLSFLVNNYRTDKSELIKAITSDMTDAGKYPDMYSKYMSLDENGNPVGVDDSERRVSTFVIKGACGSIRPEVQYMTPKDGGEFSRSYTVAEEWKADSQELIIRVSHNGEVRFVVNTDDSGTSWTAPTKAPIAETLATTNVDMTILAQALESCGIGNSKDYSYYSYLKYHAAYGNAQKLLSENSCTKSERDKATKELLRAKEDLVSVREAADFLQQIYSLDESLYHTPSYLYLMEKADILLREIVAQQPYVEGRNGSLNEISYGYVNSYINKAYNPKKKRQCIATRIDDLQQALKILIKI